MSASYLLKTGLTASTATSYTVSMWVKFTKTSFPSGTPYLWSCGDNGSGAQGLYMSSSNMKLSYYGHTSYGSGTISDGALRDLFGWYHFVWSVNSGTGTLYINGVQQSASISNVAPLNAHGGTEMAVHTYCGGLYSTYDDIGALMSHVHFIDGTAYDATAFGEYDANGVWKIKTSPSVTYGTNGFFLFKDNNSANDQSGNGNNFTASGTITKTEDNPSNVFTTWNPLIVAGYQPSFSNGNTRIQFSTSGSTNQASSTLAPNSGKYYSEFKIDASGTIVIGITASQDAGGDSFPGRTSQSWGMIHTGAVYVNDNTSTYPSYGDSFTTGDIIGIAMDLDNNYLYFSKNGTWQNSANPTSGATGTGAIDISSSSASDMMFSSAVETGSCAVSANFGNGYFGTTAVASAGTNASGIGIFEYDVPTGYTALSTKGLNL
jgi:hypothetical protein